MFSTGDVLLYTAPRLTFANLVPRLIRLVTGNKIVHVDLYIGPDHGNHVILEALFDGVRLRTFSEAELYERMNGFKLHSTAKLPNVEISPVTLMAIAVNYEGKKYGYLTILNLLLQHGKTRLFPNKQWSILFTSKDAYTCSQLTQLALEDYFNPLKPAALVEPDDFLARPWRVNT